MRIRNSTYHGKNYYCCRYESCSIEKKLFVFYDLKLEHFYAVSFLLFTQHMYEMSQQLATVVGSSILAGIPMVAWFVFRD